MAGAGRPPSLLVVAMSNAKALRLPLDINYKLAYAAIEVPDGSCMWTARVYILKISTLFNFKAFQHNINSLYSCQARK